jgi:hypothetical protein
LLGLGLGFGGPVQGKWLIIPFTLVIKAMAFGALTMLLLPSYPVYLTEQQHYHFYVMLSYVMLCHIILYYCCNVFLLSDAS